MKGRQARQDPMFNLQELCLYIEKLNKTENRKPRELTTSLQVTTRVLSIHCSCVISCHIYSAKAKQTNVLLLYCGVDKPV